MERRRKKAFTLLELLIVIIIIAVLAIVAIPQYLNAVRNAKEAGALNNMHEMRRVIKASVDLGAQPANMGPSTAISFEKSIQVGNLVSQLKIGTGFEDANYKYTYTSAAASGGLVTAAPVTSNCAGCTTFTIEVDTGAVTP